MRKWTKRTWLGIGVVAVLVGALLLMTSNSKDLVRLDVRFLGFTNPPNYSRGLALFLVSNCTDEAVAFDVVPKFQTLATNQAPGSRPAGSAQLRAISFMSSQYRLEPQRIYVFRMLYPEDGRTFGARVVYLQPHTAMEKRRARWALWFFARQWNGLARWIAPHPEVRELDSQDYRWPGAINQPPDPG